MKSTYLFFVALTFISQTVFSQEHKMKLVKHVSLRDSLLFEGAVNSRNAKESLKTRFEIPAEYEFKNQIIAETKDKTSEEDELGYVHERYD